MTVSEPALCLQCHTGHHNGAGLPLPDRCTNCHGSIHGSDVPTPSGGSRFVDKGPSEQNLISGGAAPLQASHSTALSASMARGVPSHAPTFAAGAMGGAMGMMMSSASMAPLSGGSMPGGAGGPAGTEMEAGGNSAFSFTPGAYRFVDGSGYLGRVGEYDSLQQSAGADITSAYVSTQNHLTVVSRANVLSGDDYSAATQLTAGERLQVGLFIRSFLQQQDHYNFYAFPVLDVPPGSTSAPDTTTDLIPGQSVFGVKRRLGSAYARGKVPKLPIRLFINGDWQARVGTTQLAYLDENTGNDAATCGAECHYNSQFQALNYTTRNIGGGAQVDLGQFQLTWEHTFSSFNDRLMPPLGTFGGFFPEVEGISSANPPSAGGIPADFAAGNYPLDIPAPSQASTDRLSLNWTASPNLSVNGNVSYSRVRDMYSLSVRR